MRKQNIIKKDKGMEGDGMESFNKTRKERGRRVKTTKDQEKEINMH